MILATTYAYVPLFAGLLVILLGCSVWASVRRWVCDSFSRRQLRANERRYEEQGR